MHETICFIGWEAESPWGGFRSSKLQDAHTLREILKFIGFHWTGRHMTLGGLSSKTKPPQAGSERNHMFHWMGRSMTLGGFCAYGVRIVSTHLALYLRVMTRFDLSVARSLSHRWLMLKHALRRLQNTCAVLRAHCVLLFFVSIFLSRTDGPRPSQKVSKRICRMCFGQYVASSRSHGTGVLSGSTRMHVYVRVAGGTHGIRLLCVWCARERT